MAYIELMKIRVTYESRPVGTGVKPFRRKAAGPKEHRPTFNHKLSTHATNTIAGIVCEIKLARTPISLQRISTVPVEKKSGETRMHGGAHQTVVELVRTMEDDKAMQFIDIQGQVKKCRVAPDETISFCACVTEIRIMPLMYVEAVIHIVEYERKRKDLLCTTNRKML
jgi:hypothetical protein